MAFYETLGKLWFLPIRQNILLFSESYLSSLLSRATENTDQHDIEMLSPGDEAFQTPSTVEEIIEEVVISESSEVETIESKDIPTSVFGRTSSSSTPPDNGSDERPPFRIQQLIAQAIMSSDDHQMTCNEIYQFIAKNYPYYRIEDRSLKVRVPAIDKFPS